MPRIPSVTTYSLVALLCLQWTPLRTSATSSSSSGSKQSWTASQKAAAKLMIAELDMTSFPNSLGPRREPGKRTLAQYGFVERSTFNDGWAYAKMTDDSWEFGIFVLTNGKQNKRLCVTDSSVGGGTYHATVAIDVARQPDGTWKSIKVLPSIPGCS